MVPGLMLQTRLGLPAGLATTPFLAPLHLLLLSSPDLAWGLPHPPCDSPAGLPSPSTLYLLVWQIWNTRQRSNTSATTFWLRYLRRGSCSLCASVFPSVKWG